MENTSWFVFSFTSKLLSARKSKPHFAWFIFVSFHGGCSYIMYTSKLPVPAGGDGEGKNANGVFCHRAGKLGGTIHIYCHIWHNLMFQWWQGAPFETVCYPRQRIRRGIAFRSVCLSVCLSVCTEISCFSLPSHVGLRRNFHNWCDYSCRILQW